MFSTVVIHYRNTTFSKKIWPLVAFYSLFVFAVKSIFADKIQNETICSTLGCENAGNLLKSNIDEQIDPCVDFHKFSCGGFLESNSIPENETDVSHLNNLQTKIYSQIKESLEEKVDPLEPRTFELAKNYYKSCLNESTKQQNLQTLLQIIQEIGGWPVLKGNKWKKNKFNQYEVDAKLRRKGYKPNRIFQIYAHYNYENNLKTLLFIAPPDPALQHNIFRLGLKNHIVQAYYKYMVDVAVLLGANEDVAKQELKKTINFERDLSKVARPKADFLPNVMRLKALYAVPNLRKRINWRKYINDMTEPIAHFKNSSHVNKVYTTDAYINLFQNRTMRTIANYMIWKVIAESINYLPDEYQGKAAEFYKIQFARRAYSPKLPRWKQCINLMIDKTNGLGVAVSSMYIRKHFDDSMRREIEPIVSSVANAAKEVFNKTSWMTKATRTRALRKVDYMRHIIGYPNELLNDTAIDNYYGNLTIFPDDHFQNFLNLQRFHYESDLSALNKTGRNHKWPFYSDSIEVNAYYDLVNTFVILAAILQEPLFNPLWPSYVRFGSLGFTIAHEIMHAFDPTRTFFNEHGNLVLAMKDLASAPYTERVDCLKSQYSPYLDKQTGYHLNPSLTVPENVADNGGIRVAYQAYRNWVEINGEDPRLSQLQNYTADQLFFISFSNLLCGKSTKNRKIDLLKYETHTPDDIRALMTLGNSKDFSKAYNCLRGSRMNPEKKCNIWG